MLGNGAPQIAKPRLLSAGRRNRGPGSAVPLQRLGALVELDVGAPRIVDEGKPAAERTRGKALRNGDAVGLELLEEAAQVGHVEADVIEDAALGGDDRRGALGRSACG